MVRLLSSAAVAASCLVGFSWAQSCSNNLKPDYKAPVTGDGWSYRLVAQGLKKPRGILVDDNGALLILDRGVGIVHMALNDEGGNCLSEDKKTTLVDLPDLNHGIELSEDGKTLYASTSDEVYSWEYDSEAVSVSKDKKTIVTNMDNPDHTTRTLLLSRKVPGFLIVSRGSDSNEDPDAEDIDTGRSQIRAFDIGDSPHNFTDGRVLGWGLRNSVGVGEEPKTGGIFSVENSVDNVKRNGIDVHENNPGEELNFHGNLESTDDQGGNYGYPSCYALWDTTNFPNVDQLKTGDQFPTSESHVLDDETCAKDFVAPTLTFHAHTAPLDIKFTEDGSSALIAFHGSWNRDDPVGYTVAVVDFKDGMPVEPSDSMTAAKDILMNADTADCPENCFRPVGLAWGTEGRLFMTSDTTGEIYVLVNDGSKGTGPGSSGGSSDGDDNAAPRTRSAGLVAGLAAIALSLALM